MLADVGLAAQLEEGRSHASLGSVCGTTCVDWARSNLAPNLLPRSTRAPACVAADTSTRSSTTLGAPRPSPTATRWASRCCRRAPGPALSPDLPASPAIWLDLPTQALTGLPAHNIKLSCRKLLRLPTRPSEWEAPGVPDAQAGAWPAELQVAVAGAVEGLVIPLYADERLPLPEALRSLKDQLHRHSSANAAPPAAAPPAAAPPEHEPHERTCVVCWDAPRAVRFAPCGHAVCCRRCASERLPASGGACPVCKLSVEGWGEEGEHVQLQPTFMQQRRPTQPAEAPAVPSGAQGRGGRVRPVRGGRGGRGGRA